MVFKAGKNVDSNIKVSGAFLTQISEEAEALINSTANIDLVAVYSTLSTNTKKVLQDAAGSYGAMQLIQYDMSPYTSRAEAEIMLDVLHDKLTRCLALIKDDNLKTLIGAT